MFIVNQYDDDGRFVSTYHEDRESAEKKRAELIAEGIRPDLVTIRNGGGFENDYDDLPRNQIYCPTCDPLQKPRVIVNLTFRDWIKKCGTCRVCGTVVIDYKDATTIHVPDSTVLSGYNGGGYRSHTIKEVEV